MSAPPRLLLIVEGEGEERALPLLLKRIVTHLGAPVYPRVETPFRVRKSELVQKKSLQNTIQRCASRAGSQTSILVLLDADDDCPASLGPQLQAWAHEARPDVLCSVVLANREYETWFLHAAESLRGFQDEASGLAIPDTFAAPSPPESRRDAKGWITEQIDPRPRRTFAYKETRHQAAMTQRMDLEQARRSDSFDKLFREVCRLLGQEAPPRREGAGESL